MLFVVLLGMGKASIYKYIPEYFPRDVGVVGLVLVSIDWLHLVVRSIRKERVGLMQSPGESFARS